MHKIDVATDFSPTPGGRYHSDGPHNGEDFRENFLIPALGEHGRIEVNLDGARGYPSSFLDEAFAGLVRKKGWSKKQFSEKVFLHASSSYQIYVDDVMRYIDESLRK